jgi:hypothetical protein
MTIPPPVREKEFLDVDTIREKDIQLRFAVFVRSLHGFLNQLPCLRDMQAARRRWKPRTVQIDAFGSFATEPRHWYTFNHGGRNEAQLNIGHFSTHLRLGLGFEFSMKEHGDPAAVHLAYACFINRIRQGAFQRLVDTHQFEVEWRTANNPLQYIPTKDVQKWLEKPPTEPEWIFVGRILRRGDDISILENPCALGDIMQTTFGAFRPIWEETNVLAYS